MPLRINHPLVLDNIDAIETITQRYDVDSGQLFDTVIELYSTKAEFKTVIDTII